MINKETELYKLILEYSLEDIVEASKELELISFGVKERRYQFRNLRIYSTLSPVHRWLKCEYQIYNSTTWSTDWNVCNSITHDSSSLELVYDTDCMSNESALKIREIIEKKLGKSMYCIGDRLSLIEE